MKFFKDSDLEIPVRWYFCAPGAKLFPEYNRFSSHNWDSAKNSGGPIGEVGPPPFPWSDGEPPGPFLLHLGDRLALEAYAPQSGSITSTASFVARRGYHVLVFVFSFTQIGTGQITSVTDTAGTTYVEDFQDFSASDSRVRLTVFKGKVATTTVANFLTIHFPGSQVFPTFHAVSVFGLADQAPTIVKKQSGASGTNPFVPAFTGVVGDTLAISTWSGGAATGPAVVPSGMTLLASELSTGIKEDGATAYKFQAGKRKKIQCQWTVTTGFAWISAALVYQSVSKVFAKGERFCGPLEYWQKGAPTGSSLVTDRYGVSTCCRAPFWIGCEELVGRRVRLRILAIYDKDPATHSVVGMVLEMAPNTTCLWHLAGGQVGRIGGGMLQFVLVEIDDVWWHSNFRPFPGPDVSRCTTQQKWPPSIQFSAVPVLAFNTFGFLERWDCEVFSPDLL